MSDLSPSTELQNVFNKELSFVKKNLLQFDENSSYLEQEQTNNVFKDKWEVFSNSSKKEESYRFQKEWYLTLYGFDSEEDLAKFLQTKKIIFDAGCGIGYKSAWFAELAPESVVIGMDYSNSVEYASEMYAEFPNLFFIQGNIANTYMCDGSIDYISCDQVIMHTQKPEETFSELSRIMNNSEGEFACYFYAKKALPRELLDEYFRTYCSELDSEQLWEMSEQLTELGKRLSELNVSFESPDIPVLGIKGGTYDLQRFIYWNFIKCFWNADLGRETSVAGNFDWYSPSNARRFSKDEIDQMVKNNHLKELYFHSEEACFSGRWSKKPKIQ